MWNYASVLFLMIVAVSTAHSQNAQQIISIGGEVRRPLTLSIKDLKTFPPVEINAKDKDGTGHVFKGVRLFDILDSAGVTLGKQLRGENLTKYVSVKALDGYAVIFALPEIDPEFTSQTILLAYEADGKLLSKGEGPFRLIVPSDRKHGRWVREITSIEIMFTKG